MLACFKSVNCDEAVRAVGGTNVNGNDALILEKLFVVGINFCIGRTVFFCSFNRSLFNDIAESNGFKEINIRDGTQVFAVGDAAAADNTNLDFFAQKKISFAFKQICFDIFRQLQHIKAINHPYTFIILNMQGNSRLIFFSRCKFLGSEFGQYKQKSERCYGTPKLYF